MFNKKYIVLLAVVVIGVTVSSLFVVPMTSKLFQKKA